MRQFHFRQNLIIVISLFMWIFPSCRPRQTAEKKIISQAEMDSFHFISVNEYPDYDNITRILNLLKNLDLLYVSDAINNIENIDKYSRNELLLAANIGVLLTDIGYMWSYDNIDEAINYNIYVFALSEELGMNPDFLESFFQRYSKQDADPDSILYWIERDIGNAINLFPENKRYEYYSAMLTGSFIEKLHLIFMLIKRCPEVSYPDYLSEENIKRLVWIAEGQAKALADLNKIIGDYDMPGEQTFYHKELCKLDSVMKQTDFLNDPVIVNAFSIPEDSGFNNIYNEISRLRNLIINPGATALK